MLRRLKDAAEDGIVFGVKVAVSLAIVLVTVAYLLNDYNLVRQRAANGQAAFDFLQQQVQAQQKAASAPKEKP